MENVWELVYILAMPLTNQKPGSRGCSTIGKQLCQSWLLRLARVRHLPRVWMGSSFQYLIIPKALGSRYPMIFPPKLSIFQVENFMQPIWMPICFLPIICFTSLEWSSFLLQYFLKFTSQYLPYVPTLVKDLDTTELTSLCRMFTKRLGLTSNHSPYTVQAGKLYFKTMYVMPAFNIIRGPTNKNSDPGNTTSHGSPAKRPSSWIARNT